MSRSSPSPPRRISVNIPAVQQGRLQGWLTVANAIETDCLDQLEWQKSYCVLAKEDRKLFFFNDTESVLNAPPLSPVKHGYYGGGAEEAHDGSASSGLRKNALTLLDPGYSSFQRGTRQTRSFKDKVRSSLQKTVKKNSKDESQKFASVRVPSRSRSFGKADKVEQLPVMPIIKLGHSMENLHRVGSHGVASDTHSKLGDHGTFLDLSIRGTLSIQPVHESVSPRHSCFRIITDNDILYASCGSQAELDRWVSNLNLCQRPNRNHLRRLDSQLSLWVLEARNLSPKKRYYCEVYLNGILYAQTCCKMMHDILFWGEHFAFEELPVLGSVMLKLYRENFSKKKREKVSPATDLGRVELPALILENGQMVEKWYPLTYPAGGSKSGLAAGRDKDRDKDTASVRFKVQYNVVSILPLKAYDDFLKFLRSDYSVVCEVLEPYISAKAKDEIAQTLVRILQSCGRVKELLCDIVMAEVETTENENLIFRGNTFATKAVDTYMKMVGETYLRETLSSFILVLLDSEDCEVDPAKMQQGASLFHNQSTLIRLVRRAWLDILSSYNKFPSDLWKTLHAIRQRFGPAREELCFKLISGSIFLRFLCPAILSPSLFQLCQEYPNEKTARKLTLVAKVIQNLANFTRFGTKEEYMYFMNDFVEKEIRNMKGFINKISSPVSDADTVVGWGPCNIDLGREASIMHLTLSAQLKTLQLDDAVVRRIDPLPSLLEQIARLSEEAEEDPFSSTFEALRVMHSNISSFNGSASPSEERSRGGMTEISPDRENSESSSEYTTPAQSQPTSPSHEHSPPPHPSSSSSSSLQYQARQQASIGSALQALSQSSSSMVVPTATSTVSSSSEVVSLSSTFPPPSTSPTHPTAVSSSLVSSLATHSMTALKGSGENGGTKSESSTRPRITVETPGSPRRLSDSDIQRHKVRPMSHGSELSRPPHMHTRSIDASSFKFDEHIQIAELRAENAQLLDQLERLKAEVRLSRHMAEENGRLKHELGRAEDVRRNASQDLRNLKDNRGKLLRGLNTQTEITLVQFRRDFEHLKKQLQAKEEIIAVQEKKIGSLIEANCTLRSGLQELQTLPKQEDSDSDLEEEIQRRIQETLATRMSGALNGHPFTNSLSSVNSAGGGGEVANELLPSGAGGDPVSSTSNELLRFISQLDSGKFD